MVIMFWIHNWVSFKHMYFWYLFLESNLTTHHLNIGVWLRWVIEVTTSTLLLQLRSGYPTHNTKKLTLCTIITCSINPFRVHIWARSCDQGEGSLIHTNTSGWCHLSLSITIMNLMFAFKMHHKETQVLLSNLRLATQNKHITKNQHGVSQSCIWC